MRTFGLLAAATLATLLAHSNAKAAVENYSVVSNYMVNGQAGQLTLSFSLDPSVPTFSMDISGQYGWGIYRLADWKLGSISMSYSGAVLDLPVAIMDNATYTQFDNNGNPSSYINASLSTASSDTFFHLELIPQYTTYLIAGLAGSRDQGSSFASVDNYAGGSSWYVPISSQPVQLTAAVPEPDTYALLMAGLGVLGFVGRRRPRPV